MIAAACWIGAAIAAEGVEPSFPSSPPLSIDDTETVARGHAEINLTAGLAGRRARWETEAPLLDGNYGLTDNLHVNAEIPLVFASEGGQRSAGLGDAGLAVKLRVLHKDRVQLTFHPAIALPHLSLTLPVVLDVALGAGGAGLGLQLAHTFTPALAEDTWSAAVGLAHPLGERGTLMCDGTAETDRRLRLGEGWAELGYVRESLFHLDGLTLLSAAGVSTQHNASALLGVQIGI